MRESKAHINNQTVPLSRKIDFRCILFKYVKKLFLMGFITMSQSILKHFTAIVLVPLLSSNVKIQSCNIFTLF